MQLTVQYVWYFTANYHITPGSYSTNKFHKCQHEINNDKTDY